MLNQCWTTIHDAGPEWIQYWEIVFRLLDTIQCSFLMLPLPWWHRKALTQWPPFLNVIVPIRSQIYSCWKWPSSHRHLKYSSQFLGIRVYYGRQCECRFYTAGCVNKMVVSVTGPRAVNELGGPSHTGYLNLIGFLLTFIGHCYREISDLIIWYNPYQWACSDTSIRYNILGYFRPLSFSLWWKLLPPGSERVKRGAIKFKLYSYIIMIIARV